MIPPLLYPSQTSAQFPGQILANEFYFLQDLNGDGLIYIYDFEIIGDDRPRNLINLEKNPFYHKPKKYIPSWSSYIKNNLSEIKNY